MIFDHSRETLQGVLVAAGVEFRGNACRCPFHDDKRASAGIYERGDAWRFKCQVCGKGGDVEDVRKLLGQTPPVAHNGNGKADPPLPKTARSWPTLDGAVTAALASVARGFPGAVEAGRWIYRDASGADVGAVVRFDLPTADGGKQDKTFRPVHRVPGGWAMGDPAGKWRVYRLPELLAALKAGAGRVYVCEGEKATDAAAGCGLVCVTSAHGAKSADKTEWGPLAGAGEVVLLPDHDEAGEGYAETVARIVGALHPAPVVRVVKLADLAGVGFPKGGDFVDFSADFRDGQEAESIRMEIDAAADCAPVLVVKAKGGVDELASSPRSTVRPFQPFPVEVLPAVLADLVNEGAAALGCDPSQIALPVLAACSGAIGNSRRVALKSSWKEPAVIWGAVVLPSGALKSPALDLALEPIRKAQHDAIQRHKEAMMHHEADVEEWERKDKRTRGDKPSAPVCARIVVSDTTVEALGMRLAEQASGRGLLCEREEISGVLKGLNQYKAKGGADEAHWLTFHGARALTMDRKTGDVKLIHCPRAFVSLIGTIQPGILRRAMSAEFRESGFAARVLLAMPPVQRRRWSEAVVGEAVKHRYSAALAGLLAIPMGGDVGDPAPVDLPLTPEAKALFAAFVDAHGVEQDGMDGDLAAAWCKLEGYAARLALILHCVRVVCGEADGGAVDGVSMAAGIALARWFGGEAERVYGMLGGNAVDDELAGLWRFILERGGRITARELRDAKAKYHAPRAAQEALNRAAEAGYGRWEEVAPGAQGGRPMSVFVATQPASAQPINPLSAIRETLCGAIENGGNADADTRMGGVVRMGEDDRDYSDGNPDAGAEVVP